MKITERLRKKFSYVGMYGTVGRRRDLLTQVNKTPMCRAYCYTQHLTEYLDVLSRSKAKTVRIEIEGYTAEILTSHKPPTKAKCWLIISSETPHGSANFN